MNSELCDLIEKIKSGDESTDDLVESAFNYLKQLKLDPDGAAAVTIAHLADSDGVLAAANKIVPGWSVHLTGKAYVNDGHWTCTLRRSQGRDNDDFVGIGKAKQMHHALLSALLETAEYVSNS